ncbi:hypothetical protein IWQ60_010267 [Tieghemiomyces parasiticus]|uniref:Uncharacterized protein n=1 Tax=Tieghemiomyces parasiticus TaxID=78921 RepID=A0A9W8DN66_9FUNG|nr:hypothetical protein IWQ60_010267 [Tieghemiomyces parasiticus]
MPPRDMSQIDPKAMLSEEDKQVLREAYDEFQRSRAALARGAQLKARMPNMIFRGLAGFTIGKGIDYAYRIRQAERIVSNSPNREAIMRSFQAYQMQQSRHPGPPGPGPNRGPGTCSGPMPGRPPWGPPIGGRSSSAHDNPPSSDPSSAEYDTTLMSDGDFGSRGDESAPANASQEPSPWDRLRRQNAPPQTSWDRLRSKAVDTTEHPMTRGPLARSSERGNDGIEPTDGDRYGTSSDAQGSSEFGTSRGDSNGVTEFYPDGTPRTREAAEAVSQSGKVRRNRYGDPID